MNPYVKEQNALTIYCIREPWHAWGSLLGPRECCEWSGDHCQTGIGLAGRLNFRSASVVRCGSRSTSQMAEEEHGAVGQSPDDEWLPHSTALTLLEDVCSPSFNNACRVSEDSFNPDSKYLSRENVSSCVGRCSAVPIAESHDTSSNATRTQCIAASSLSSG
ncbi:unnamed protein product [Dicrocoelium dendriticum]|nr:unnamed protein product [Dicrocoelium dendriticum]